MQTSVTGSSVRSGNDPVHESETKRLQNEVDIYTQKFENEKRKLQILQDQIKQIEHELYEKKEIIQKTKPKQPVPLSQEMHTDAWVSDQREKRVDKYDNIRLAAQKHDITNE